jgi:hypothetical protein
MAGFKQEEADRLMAMEKHAPPFGAGKGGIL